MLSESAQNADRMQNVNRTRLLFVRSVFEEKRRREVMVGISMYMVSIILLDTKNWKLHINLLEARTTDR